MAFTTLKAGCTPLLDDLPESYCAVTGAACHFRDGSPKRKRIVMPSELDGDVDIEKFVSGQLRVEGMSGCLFRKQALDRIGGYDEGPRNIDDFDLLLRLSAHFKVRTHADVTFYWRNRKDSFSQGDPLNSLVPSLQFVAGTEKRRPSIVPAAFARRRQRAYFNAAFLSLKRG